MAKYKILVKLGDQNQFWILIANDKKLIRNPTEEDIKDAKLKSYSDTNICPECVKENKIIDKSILYPGNAYRRTDETGRKTKEFLCQRHGYISYQRNDINSRNNIIKALSDRRTGNLTYSNSILGDDCQTLTCKLYGVEDLNKIYDNYEFPLDHSGHPELGLIQSKGRRYNSFSERWSFAWQQNHFRATKFDYGIFYCISKDGKTIERIYIFPRNELIIRNGIGIDKNTTTGRGVAWYEKYRVVDKDIIDNANNLWKKIRNKKQPGIN